MNRLNAHIIMLLLTLPVCAEVEPCLNFSEGENFQRVITSFADTGEPVSFRIAHGPRTLAAGSARVEAGCLLRLEMTLPEMKPGVALPVEVTFSRRDFTQAETCKAWVFSKIPPPVKPKRKVYLVDDIDGKTAEWLDTLSVEFETVRNTETIATLTNAFIIVGEEAGNDVAVWKAVLHAAERGADVLRLAPEEKSMIVLPHDLQQFSIDSEKDILRDTSAPYYLSVLDLGYGGLRLIAHDGEVALRMDCHASAQAAQWRYYSGGRVRVCGIPLCVTWERTPSIRWLLAEMIMTGEKP